MAGFFDLGGGRFFTPGTDVDDLRATGACLFGGVDTELWYGVDGFFYYVYTNYEESEDGTAYQWFEQWRTTAQAAEEFLTGAYDADEAKKMLAACFVAEHGEGEGKTPFEAVVVLSTALTEMQPVDLKRADEKRLEAYGDRVRTIAALLARVVRSMETEPTRTVLRYDVGALLNGALKRFSTSNLT
jgi:hypothetical protein